VDAISIFAPAKLNLFLAITGRRADGFHDLISVAVKLDFGDTVRAEPAPSGFTLACDDPALSVDETNLVLKAARAFADAAAWRGGAKFFLEKKIPVGAGLGGGSSDAVAALHALNEIAGGPLDRTALLQIAAKIGSDCPLFFYDGPVVMRGRGERVEPLGPSIADRLASCRVLVCKPDFGISTPWAYAQFAVGAPGTYLPPAEAEARLGAWLSNPDARPAELLFNNMEPAAFEKFPALPSLAAQLRREYGIDLRMSGSGSACFAIMSGETPTDSVAATIRAAWGKSVFIIEARMIPPGEQAPKT
jgi:4-diphosphocytidyl-2-C-methyl-D-erythritol kinase